MNQKGLAQIFLIVILLAGLGLGIYLVQQKTSIFPKASISTPTSPETSFTLVAQGSPYSVGKEFQVLLYVRSDVIASNLFSAKIRFPVDLMEVVSINTEGLQPDPFIKNWVERFYDNQTGEISLVGGIPTPGVQTSVNQPSQVMAQITFKVKANGNAVISFSPDSAIYSNADNLNVLTTTREATVPIGFFLPIPTATPTPTAIPTPAPSATPVPGVKGSGDGNNDGRVDLVDLSVLLSDFNREAGFRLGIDLNGDGKINTFDFALMKNLLVEKKVIRG